MSYEPKTIEELKGQTITSFEHNSEEVVIETAEGKRYRMYHSQDCCESVTVDNILGVPSNLIGSPIVLTKEEYPDKSPDWNGESCTLTNFTLATAAAEVTIYWIGESNGYYSESVEFVEL